MKLYMTHKERQLTEQSEGCFLNESPRSSRSGKLKFLQGYVTVRLLSYAPERFLNLCSRQGIFIWNLTYHEECYEFCISIRSFRRLKPILRKTRSKVIIKKRTGLPFLMHRYRKRKVFFGGIALCAAALYVMSLFVWNIEVSGNLHRTDSAIIKFLEENDVYHGVRKSKLDCAALEELLRSQYDDIIWASVKIQGTRLVIDLQENLISNSVAETVKEDSPSDLIAGKNAEIYSIFTRQGTPLVEKGSSVKLGDVLVEGRIPIYNDSAELVRNKQCYADADILGITTYTYQDSFPLTVKDKVFTGKEKSTYSLRLFQKMLRLSVGKQDFSMSDRVTTERPLKLGENFYLPLVLYKEVSKEYVTRQKTYTPTEAEALARNKIDVFCKKLVEKGVQIIENNVMIVTDGKNCTARGDIIVIEPVGVRRAAIPDEPHEEGLETNESDGNND